MCKSEWPIERLGPPSALVLAARLPYVNVTLRSSVPRKVVYAIQVTLLLAITNEAIGLIIK